MNENAFWQLIGDCTPSMPDPDAEQLAAALTTVWPQDRWPR
ncbi:MULTISPECIES: hypothetical protein [unclassified Streptomyces]|nr:MULTISPECIES: hypothetical protein [unclassified Streptomyces]